MKNQIREHMIDLTAAVVGLFGLLLLFKQINLLGLLLRVLHKLTTLLYLIGDRTDRGALFSQAVGGVLMLGILAFITFRMRDRFQNSPQWKAGPCPKCGGPVHRFRRTALDRLLANTLLPQARRYRCANPRCGWEGLRQRGEDEYRSRSLKSAEDF